MVDSQKVQLVLASHNQHKLVELSKILNPLLPEIQLQSYHGPEAKETGTSFSENALIKARAAAVETGLPAIADDSGIAVDILGGSPGIFSARWAGPQRSDSDNLNLLLWQLSDISAEHRSAAFHCAAALVIPDSKGGILFEQAVEGIWPGEIVETPAGVEGFGYDPIFKPSASLVTAAELTPEQKNLDSHRSRAFSLLAEVIREKLITS